MILMEFPILSAGAPAAFPDFVEVFTFASIAFLIFKISAGRNWARITFLVTFVIAMLLLLLLLPLMLGESFLPFMLGYLFRSPVVGALWVALLGLRVYALFLLFTQPGSAWFRKVAPA